MQTATRYRRQNDIFHITHSFLTSRKTIIAYFFGSWIRIQLEYTINHTQQFVISPNTCQTLDFIVFAPDY